MDNTQEQGSGAGSASTPPPQTPAPAPTPHTEGAGNGHPHTAMAIIAYIIFFVPLLTDSKDEPFVKYHVKQGLVLFIGWIASMFLSFIPFIGLLALPLNLALFVLMIIGIVNAAQGKQKPLPLVGHYGEQFKL